MSSPFRAALVLAYAVLCFGVPAQAQSRANLSPSTSTFSSSTAITAWPEYTGRVRYGDTGKPAAGIRVLFRKEESIDGRLPSTGVATTDAAGCFHLSRYALSFSQDDFIWFQVDDPHNCYAAEVVQGYMSFEEEMPGTTRPPGTDWVFLTLTQFGSDPDDAYPDGILRFVPRSTWQDKNSVFITLQTGTFVSGTVTDSATGRPLSGIRVYTRGPHNREAYYRPSGSPLADAYTAITDTAGRYHLPVVPGECEVKIDIQTDLDGESYEYKKVAFDAVHGKTSTVDVALSPDEIARLKRDESEKQKRYGQARSKDLQIFQVSVERYTK